MLAHVEIGAGVHLANRNTIQTTLSHTSNTTPLKQTHAITNTTKKQTKTYTNQHQCYQQQTRGAWPTDIVRMLREGLLTLSTTFNDLNIAYNINTHNTEPQMVRIYTNKHTITNKPQHHTLAQLRTNKSLFILLSIKSMIHKHVTVMFHL